MRKIIGTLLFLSVWWVMGGLVACSGASPDQPPKIRYGEDMCDECKMLISEARFAAAYITENGDVRRFDDIGGMFVYHQKHMEPVARYWVHDYKTSIWIRGDQAVYVHSPNIQTPMGYGVVAFKNRSDAESFASEKGGKILTLQDLLANPPQPMMGGKMKMPMKGGVTP